MKVCSSCKQGGEVFTEEDGELKNVIVRDPDNGQIVISGWLCGDHIEMYASDGYTVRPK